MTTQEIISNNLICLRKKAGFTQSDLADKLNYTEQAISKWERGLSLPDADMLQRIANLFQVSIEYLFQYHQYMPLSSEEENKLKKRAIKIKVTYVISIATILLILTSILLSTLIKSLQINIVRIILFILPAIPLCSLILNLLLGKKKYVLILFSLTIWSLANALYFYYINYKLDIIYAIAIVIQIGIIGFPLLEKYFIPRKLPKNFADHKDKNKKDSK